MKLNIGRLNAIKTSLEKITKIDKLLERYGEEYTGAVSASIKMAVYVDLDVQFDTVYFREFLISERDRLIKSLEDRYEGFEYDPDANSVTDWVSD